MTYDRVRARSEPTPVDPNWSIYSRVKWRLEDLDAPDPDGWTAEELAELFGCSGSYMRKVLQRLVRDGHAMVRDGRYLPY